MKNNFINHVKGNMLTKVDTVYNKMSEFMPEELPYLQEIPFISFKLKAVKKEELDKLKESNIDKCVDEIIKKILENKYIETLTNNNKEDLYYQAVKTIYDRTKKVIPNIVIYNSDKKIKLYGEHSELKQVKSKLLENNEYLFLVKDKTGIENSVSVLESVDGLYLDINNSLIVKGKILNN